MAISTALIVIDVQNDFMTGGSMGVPAGDDIILAINKVRRSCRDTLAAVVTTQDHHPLGHVSFASSHPGLRPGMQDIKLVYNAEGRLLAYRYPDVMQPSHPPHPRPSNDAPPAEESPQSAGLLKLQESLCPSYAEAPPTSSPDYVMEDIDSLAEDSDLADMHSKEQQAGSPRLEQPATPQREQERQADASGPHSEELAEGGYVNQSRRMLLETDADDAPQQSQLTQQEQQRQRGERQDRMQAMETNLREDLAQASQPDSQLQQQEREQLRQVQQEQQEMQLQDKLQGQLQELKIGLKEDYKEGRMAQRQASQRQRELQDKLQGQLDVLKASLDELQEDDDYPTGQSLLNSFALESLGAEADANAARTGSGALKRVGSEPMATAKSFTFEVLQGSGGSGNSSHMGMRMSEDDTAAYADSTAAVAGSVDSAAVEEECLLSPTLGHHPRHASHGSVTSSHIVLTQRLWPDHCVAGTAGSDLAPGLLALPTDIIVRKGVDADVDDFSAFYDNGRFTSTGLHEQLQALGVQRVLLTGVVTEYCVLWTARDAVELGYQVRVLRDGVCGMIQADAQAALAEMASMPGVKVVDAEDVITEIARSGATLDSLQADASQ